MSTFSSVSALSPLLLGLATLVLLAGTSSASMLPPFSVYAQGDFTSVFSGAMVQEPNPIAVRGAGSIEITDFVHALPVFAKLMDNYSTVTFNELGSPQGMCRLANYSMYCANPWAGTGNDIAHPVAVNYAIVSRQTTDAMFNWESDISMYPILAEAVGVIHNIKGLVQPLVLTSLVLGRIFRKCDLNNNATCLPGDIRYWNDPQILATNPLNVNALNLAGEIRLMVRSDFSGTSRAIRTVLSTLAQFF